MSSSAEYIDKPEPRGQALLAFLAICAIYLALPRSLIVGPIWLLPTLIVVLLVPTVVSHRVGRHSLNRVLGIIINGITTLALIGSVILLVRALPTHRESPLQLLRSGGLLWLTNVIVFALWYWRLDGGGPTLRHKENKFGSTSFLFPHRRPAAGALGEGPGDDPDFDLAHYFDLAHLTSGRRSVGTMVNAKGAA